MTPSLLAPGPCSSVLHSFKHFKESREIGDQRDVLLPLISLKIEAMFVLILQQYYRKGTINCSCRNSLVQSVFPVNFSMERWVTGHTCKMHPGVCICIVSMASVPTDGWPKDFFSFYFILVFFLNTQEQSKPSCQQRSECRAFSNEGVTLISV